MDNPRQPRGRNLATGNVDVGLIRAAFGVDGETVPNCTGGKWGRPRREPLRERDDERRGVYEIQALSKSDNLVGTHRSDRSALTL